MVERRLKKGEAECFPTEIDNGEQPTSRATGWQAENGPPQIQGTTKQVSLREAGTAETSKRATPGSPAERRPEQ